MTVDKARRARARALVVPVAMSALMWIVIGELLLGRHGPAMLLTVVLVLATTVSTRAGEKWLARLFLRARAPRLHQRHTLAPVAHVLLGHGVSPVHLVLLVGPGSQVDVTALGGRTVVVSRGLIEDVHSGHLALQAAAAVITHELGVMRAGLTRSDPALMVLLAPWKIWFTCIAILWGIAAAFLPHRLMVACLVINAGAGAWLGTTQDPVAYLSTAAMAVVAGTWWALRSWERARAQVGDQYLAQTGLAGVYADLLDASFTDDDTRDRAVRLRHLQPQHLSPVPPTAPHGPLPATALLT